MTYEIRYRAGGREKLICFTEREETPELVAEATAVNADQVGAMREAMIGEGQTMS